MLKVVGAALRGLAVGGVVGLTVGVAVAFFHLNVRAPVFLGFSLSASILGLVLGAAVGVLTGVGVSRMRSWQRE